MAILIQVDLILYKNLDEPLMNFIWQQNINEVTPNIYNVFRIENRLPMHGSELVDNYNPLEANLLDNISFNKGCYVGQENTSRIKLKNKLTKRLFPIKIIEGNINEGDLIVNEDSEVGKVLIGKKYPFALIKITSDKFDFNSTLKINDAKVKIIKPDWL